MHKFVLPVLWVAVVVLLFAFRPLYSHLVGTGLRPAVGWVGGFLGAAFLYWTYILFECLQLKRVDLEDDHLRVSNFREEVEIPLAEVERVSASAFVTPELIWLHLRHPTVFGETVVFAPPIRFFGGFWHRHPLASELRHRIRNTHARNGSVVR